MTPLNTGRHGTQAVVAGEGIYITSGSPNQGGGNMTNMEVFSEDNPGSADPILISALVNIDTSLGFLPVAIGDTTTSDLLVYNNGSNQGIFINSITLNADLSQYEILDTLNFPFLLKAGDTLSLSVRYAPTNNDPITGSIDITHSGSNPALNIPFENFLHLFRWIDRRPDEYRSGYCFTASSRQWWRW